MKWIDHKTLIELCPPAELNFAECLQFLNRSDQEVLHQISDNYLYKLIKVNDKRILIKIGSTADSIRVEFPLIAPTTNEREEVAAYVWEWFNLNEDLKTFYLMARQDYVLKNIVDNYYGLRMICIPDLFEALTWAIIGQQINLTFAYKLKKRFVEQYGESLSFEGETFWLFPSYEKIAMIDVEDLRKLQFTARKAEYMIGVAKAMTAGELSKEMLLQIQDYEPMKKKLMAIRGIGAWSADYVLMKCLQHPLAFPIADVGLHNALKVQLGLERKPGIEEIEGLAKNWEGWQAYATFYLWRSLYDKAI
ncbi:DNA-3-methyladenine glycosylase family protein [Cytobacillus sp. FJAT-53684]|uniref:DNA-3-methyladenine glycosylase II n=1 Tax=Cytobacillus mangrovibacter TaxID=3299024 RepID=A0ABW6K4E0_9BACI